MGELLSSHTCSCSSGDLCGLLVILVDLCGAVGPSGGSSPGFDTLFSVFLLSYLVSCYSLDLFVAAGSVVAYFVFPLRPWSFSIPVGTGLFPSPRAVRVSSPCMALDVGFFILSTLDGVPSNSACFQIDAPCR